MKFISGILAVLGVASAKVKFPEFSDFHPYCEMTTIYNRRCALAYEDFHVYIKNVVDPFNKNHHN